MVPASSAPNQKPDPVASHSAEHRIPSCTIEARRIQDEIEQLLRTHHYCEADLFAIKLAVEEALVNAVKHGNQLSQDKKVHITYCIRPDRFEIHITDEGTGFAPQELPDPTTPEYLERPCGRGVMLMRHYMTEVVYNERGNSVRMIRHCHNGTK